LPHARALSRSVKASGAGMKLLRKLFLHPQQPRDDNKQRENQQRSFEAHRRCMSRAWRASESELNLPMAAPLMS
jgi:hypothetical protein